MTMSQTTCFAWLFGIYVVLIGAVLIGVAMLVHKEAMVGIIMTADKRAVVAIVLGLWLGCAGFSG